MDPDTALTWRIPRWHMRSNAGHQPLGATATCPHPPADPVKQVGTLRAPRHRPSHVTTLRCRRTLQQSGGQCATRTPHRRPKSSRVPPGLPRGARPALRCESAIAATGSDTVPFVKARGGWCVAERRRRGASIWKSANLLRPTASPPECERPRASAPRSSSAGWQRPGAVAAAGPSSSGTNLVGLVLGRRLGER